MKKFTTVFIFCTYMSLISMAQKSHPDLEYMSLSNNQKANNKIIWGSVCVGFGGAIAHGANKTYTTIGPSSYQFAMSAAMSGAFIGVGAGLIIKGISMKMKDRKDRRFKKAIQYNNH